MASRRKKQQKAIPSLCFVVLIVVIFSSFVTGTTNRAVPPAGVAAPSSGLWFGDNNSSPSLLLPSLSISSFGTWPIYDQNALRTGNQSLERTLAPGNVSLLSLAPHFPFVANGSIAGSVAAANGTAYFGSMGGQLYALNETTATIHGPASWFASTTGLAMDNSCGSTWPRGIISTPAVWGNLVIVGTGDSVGLHHAGYGWVRAYYATGTGIAGTIAWQQNLSTYQNSSWTGAYIWSSPVVWNGDVYVGFASGCDGPLVQGALFQLNATTGLKLHTAQLVLSNETGASVWSSPSIDPKNNTIWVTTGNNYYASPNENLTSSIIELNLSNVSQIKAHWQVQGIQGLDDDFGAGVTIVTGAHGVPIAIATNKDGSAYAINRSNVAMGPIWQDAIGGPPQQGAITPAAAGGNLVYLAGGPPGLTYSYTGIPSLPPGCMSTNSPTLKCTPSSAASGLYVIETKATDSANHVGFTNTSLTVTSSGLFQITHYSTSTPYGVAINKQTQFTVAVAHPSGTVSYSYTGLPPGCTSSNTAVLPCTPSTAGAYRVEVYANESGGSQTSVIAILTLGVVPQSTTVQVLGSFNQNPTVAVGQPAVIQTAFSSTRTPGSMWGVFAGNGTAKWVHGSPGFFYAGPTYANGLVIDAAIAGNYSWTTIEVLNATTGGLLTSYNVTGMVTGEPIVADGRIYFGTTSAGFTGNGDLYALEIRLYAQPNAHAVSASHPTVQFDGLGIGGSPPYSCTWLFGNGVKSSVCGTVSTIYGGTGIYTANLFVNDTVAESSTWAYTIQVLVNGGCLQFHPCPYWILVGNFSSGGCYAQPPSLFCPVNGLLDFYSYNTGGTLPYTYLWNFGDGTQSELAAPDHQYSESGQYKVTLTLTDAHGLQGSAQFEVTAN